MIQRVVSFILLWIMSSTWSMQQPEQLKTIPNYPPPPQSYYPPGCTVILNAHANSTGGNCAVVTQQENNQSATLEAHQSVYQQIINNTSQWYTSAKKESVDGINHFLNCITNHPYRTGLIGITTAYMMICYKLTGMYNYCLHTDRWSQWKKHCSMQQLYAIPFQKLGDELTRAVQYKYLNTTQPTDFISPLVTFINDITYELDTLDQYRSLAKKIRRCRLEKIFPINEKKRKRIRRARERAIFLKQLFISWMVQQNMLNNTQLSTPYLAPQ